MVATAVALLVVLAVAHSVLGERAVITPLLADGQWRLPALGRRQAGALLRFAWHLTTLLLVGLALALVADPRLVVAAVALISGGVVLVLLRGHLAWPVFLAIALAAGLAADVVPGAVLVGLAAVGVTVALVAAGFHVAWAMGRALRSRDLAVPRRAADADSFQPGAALTLGVAVLLTGLAATVVATITTDLVAARWLAGLALALLVVRSIGDGRQVGFSKTDRSTAFARADDAWWTPAVVVLGFGVAGALLA